MRRISLRDRAAVCSLALLLLAVAAEPASADGVTVQFAVPPAPSTDQALPPLIDTTASADWQNTDGTASAIVHRSGLSSVSLGTLTFTVPTHRPCPPYDPIQVAVQDMRTSTVLYPSMMDVDAQGTGSFSTSCSGVSRSFPYFVDANVRAETPDPQWREGTTILQADLLRFTGSDVSGYEFDWDSPDCQIQSGVPTVQSVPDYCWSIGFPTDNWDSEIVHQVR